MARTDDFGDHGEAEGSSASLTPEDATLHGQPIEDAPGEATGADPDLAGSGTSEADVAAVDPAHLGDDR